VRIALRTALHQRRHFGARERVGDYSDGEMDVADTSPLSPLEQAISRERRRILRDLLDQLAEPVAATLALHFMLGMTVIEIAKAENISANTVWSRLRLGKQSLKKALARDGRLDDLLGGAQ
jgi:RNA polymerase sigma-70 factor (ECF subfamily)